jgi:hypothetical protein
MVYLLLFASLFAIVGCGSDSEISFRICGKLDVPKQLDALRISILDEALTEQNFALIELTEREVALEGGPKDKANSDDDQPNDSEDGETDESTDSENESRDQPATTRSLPIIASLTTGSGSGYVRVQALLKGVEVARFDRQVPKLDAVSAVDMPLAEKCYGRYNCALGQTCVKGECVVAPYTADPPTCD